MTGGSPTEVGQSAEVFLPGTGSSCLVSASLVLDRFWHSQDGLLACGGTTCEHFSPATGSWALTGHTLQQERQSHVSWSVEEGTILMGGVSSGTTSEIVKHDGTTERTFELQYDTAYEQFIGSLIPLPSPFITIIVLLYLTRYACSIPDPSSATVVVTGGAHTLDTVSRYVLYCTVLYCTVLYCSVLSADLWPLSTVSATSSCSTSPHRDHKWRCST